MTKKMSILISTWTYPPQANGVSHVAAAHAEGLAELGNEVTVVTSYDPERDIFYSPNIRVVQFEIGGGARRGQKGYHGDIKAFQQYIADFKADAILCHCWASWNTELALEAFPHNPAKRILVSHGVSFNLGGFLTRLAWCPYIERLPNKFKMFDRIVFLSERSDQDRFFDKHLIEKLGFTNWTVIPNGTYPEDFSEALPDFRQAFDIDRDKRIILYVASYGPNKNQEMALNAFMRLVVKIPLWYLLEII